MVTFTIRITLWIKRDMLFNIIFIFIDTKHTLIKSNYFILQFLRHFKLINININISINININVTISTRRTPSGRYMNVIIIFRAHTNQIYSRAPLRKSQILSWLNNDLESSLSSSSTSSAFNYNVKE